MRHRFVVLMLLLFIGLLGEQSWSAAAKAPSFFQCQNYESVLRHGKVRYCLRRSHPEIPLQADEPVVYVMHGIFGNAGSWNVVGYESALSAMVGEGSYPAVTFVSFDTAGFSFFSDVGGVGEGPWAYESWFLNEFVPYVQKTHRLCAKSECRGLIGTSMGGFGALKTGFKNANMFHFVGVNSPALSPFTIHREDSEWSHYWAKQVVGSDFGMMLLSGVRLIFPSKELEELNDPIVLAEKFVAPESFPPIYMDVGDQDEYGFFEGFARLDAVLKRRGFHVESQIYPHEGHNISRERARNILQFVSKSLAPHS